MHGQNVPEYTLNFYGEIEIMKLIKFVQLNYQDDFILVHSIKNIVNCQK